MNRTELRRLLLVLGSGIAFACLMTVFGVYYYGPSGRYIVKNALISPDILEKMSYNAPNQKINANDRFIFDDIVFSYYNSNENKMSQLSASLDQYKKFYQSIVSDVSLLNVPLDIEALFLKVQPASLILRVKTESNAAWQKESKIFQEVHFAREGNYFRIKLHEQEKSNNWVYFHHPHIYQDVLNQFIPPLPSH